jgi:hypothetical protein
MSKCVSGSVELGCLTPNSWEVRAKEKKKN